MKRHRILYAGVVGGLAVGFVWQQLAITPRPQRGGSAADAPASDAPGEGAARYSAAPARTNIVLVLADDLGQGNVGRWGWAPAPGGLPPPPPPPWPSVTPVIDRLAGESVVLARHYTNYMCTPTRASLMTGLHSLRTGLQHYVLLLSQPTGSPRQLP